MDIIRALKREEAKIEENVKNVMKHLNIVRATVKFFGGSAKPKLAGRKRRMSAAGRLAISKATKARWAKVRELKATAAEKTTRKMSAATRARMAKSQQQRWAKARITKAKKAA